MAKIFGVHVPVLQKNYLINSNFDFWQRNTTFSAPAQFSYLADRWYNQSGANTSVTVSRQGSENPVGGTWSLYWTAGSTSSQFNINQAIESNLVKELNGNTVTFSVYLRKSSGNARDYQIAIAKNSTADVSNGGTWTTIATTTISNASISSFVYTRFSVTVTVPSDGTANGLKVLITDTSTGLATDTIFVAGSMLNLTSNPLTYQMHAIDYQSELLVCQRYCRTLKSGVAKAGATTTVDLDFTFWPEMRASPSATATGALQVTDVVAADFNQSSANVQTSGLPFDNRGGRIRLGNFTGLTTGGMYFFEADGTGQIYFESEL